MITYRAENAENGGAAVYNNGGTATLTNVEVTNNLKNYVNGDLLIGVIYTNGTMTISDSYLANNSGRWGGAVTLSNGTLTVENTTFENNQAIFGGAIYNADATLIVDNCTFNNNKGVGEGSAGTSDTQGGAILLMDDASLDIKDSEFVNNSAKLGGGISIAGASGDCTLITVPLLKMMQQKKAELYIISLMWLL